MPTPTSELVKAVPYVKGGNVVQWKLTMSYAIDDFVREFSDFVEQQDPTGYENFPLKPALSFTQEELKGLVDSQQLEIVFNAHYNHFLNQPEAAAVPDIDFDLTTLDIGTPQYWLFGKYYRKL